MRFFENMPDTMRGLPVDHRGFPVPWFVAFIDGKPDFRIIRQRGIETAVKQNRCWVCGTKLGRMKAFVIGPMCAVNRVSSEPPSHPQCAAFSAINCPFLANPRMRRNDKGIEEAEAPGGVMIARNPGVALVWQTLRFSMFPDGRGGQLFNVGKPERVAWYANGKAATRDEVLASIDSGLPILSDMAAQQGPEALHELGKMHAAAMQLVPA